MIPPSKAHDDEFTDEETDQRLRKIMRGAFSGPPTPLAAVPTRHGEMRAGKQKPSRPKSGSSDGRKKAKRTGQ